MKRRAYLTRFAEDHNRTRTARICEFYARRAKGYEREASRHWSKDESLRCTTINLAHESISGVKASKPRILDIGTGTGQSLYDIADVNAGDFYGLDLSVEMLSSFAKKLMLRPAASPISLIVGDAHMLPFVDDCFDVLLCLRTMQYLRLPEVIKEFHRALRFGGHCLIAVVTVHDDDVDDFRNSIGVFTKQPYFSRFHRKSELRNYFLREGFHALKEDEVVVRRYFSELVKDKGQYVDKSRLKAVIERFLNATTGQKEMYGIDNEGFNQFYSFIIFELAANSASRQTSPFLIGKEPF